MQRLEDKAWWPELLKNKDDFSLRELGEKYGATPGAINSALKRNNITRKPAPPGPRKRRGRPAPAPAAVVAEAAQKRSGGAPKGPRKATLAKLLPFRDQLGATPDRTIAALAGVSIQTVASYRKHLGIGARRGRRPKVAPVVAVAKKNPGPGRSAIAPYADQLGQVPDGEIASLAGVSENAVRNYRNRRGIAAPSRAEAPVAESKPTPQPKPAPKTKAAPTPAAKPAPAAAPAAGGQAWRVQVGDRSVIVVAPNVVEAATRASAAGAVSNMELLGDVLA